MKKIHYIACAILLLAACVEDPGKTELLPAAAVTPGAATGVNDVYTVVALDTLVIHPVIEGGLTDNTYTWYVYPYPSYIGSPKDTIGREQNLDYRVALPAGRYELLLEVKNKQRLTATYTTATLNVTREFSRGWFISKEVNGAADIDFVRLGNNAVYPDILQAINGERPAGKPLDNGYIYTYYGYERENNDGTVTRVNDQPAFFLTTDADLRVYHADDMSLIKRFDDAFFEQPATRHPRALFQCEGGTVVLNDASLHSIWYGSYNVGRFGYPVTLPTSLRGADIAPQAIRVGGSAFIFFDNNTSSLVALTAFSSTLATLPDYGYYPSCTNMNVDLVYMREQELFGGAYCAYALVKNRTSGAYSVLRLDPIYVTYGMSPVNTTYAVPDGSPVTAASVYALHQSNDALYYSAGDNKLSYYSIRNKIETPDIITLPDGEQIVRVHHVYNDNMDFECLAVLANKDNRWTLYCYNFKGSTSDVQLPAFQTFSGEGKAHSFLYRDVQVSYTN
ncbi:MAG: hypothetical protein LBG30_00830 [Odoribacteraceae bacterium]|jgi:hypothetical protein|nr:hypothetical protein [Odoribacteraceae bacterium]